MALPEKYHLDQVRKLRGDAQVTVLDTTNLALRVERVVTEPRNKPKPSFLSTDTEYSSAKLVEQTIVGGDANHVEIYRVWHTLPGAETVRWTVDEETRAPVKITTRLVAAPAGALNQAAGTQSEYVPINAVHGTLITTQINGGTSPGNRVEYRYVDYTFPALVFFMTGGGITGRDGSAHLRITSSRRGAFTRTVRARVEITYGPIGVLTLAEDLFNPKFGDLLYEGIAFNIAERNVLNDGFTLTYGSGTNNPRWPDFTETFQAFPSPFSASAYQSKIDATGPEGDICIGSIIRPWKAGLERRENIYVKAQ